MAPRCITLSAVLVAGWALCTDSKAADVSFFALYKGEIFVQSGPGQPMLQTVGGQEMHAFAFATPDAVTSATLKWPNGTSRGMGATDTAWRYRQAFDTRSALNFAAPSGTYSFTFVTQHDGQRTIVIGLSSDFYPAAPRLSAFDELQAMDWQKPAALKWDGPGADFAVVEVRDGSEIVFQTGAIPNGPGALSARSVSATIPAGTLEEGRVYDASIMNWTRISSDQQAYPGALGWTGYARTTKFPIRTMFKVNDVWAFGCYKKQRFTQTSPLSPMTAQGEAWEVVSFCEAAGVTSVLQATALVGAGAPQVLNPTGNYWNGVERYASKAAMDAARPDGAITMRMLTTANGLREIPLTLTGAFPNHPQISNWYEANSIESTKPFTLRWNPLTGGTADDFIQVRVLRDGAAIFSTGQRSGSPGALDGRDSSVELPAGLLAPGETAELQILFLKAAQVERYAYPKALGLSGTASETTATIRARGGDVQAPELSQARKIGSQIEFTLQTEAGRVCGLETGSDLVHWQTLLMTNAPAELFQLRIPTGSADHAWFRAFVY